MYTVLLLLFIIIITENCHNSDGAIYKIIITNLIVKL